MSLKKFISKSKSRGLPGGPNEFEYSVEGYKNDSPDKDNPYNIIDSGNITMKGVDYPVHGTDDLGNEQIMYPGKEYQFPGSQVFEVPMKQEGGDYHTMPDGIIMPGLKHNDNIKNKKLNKQVMSNSEYKGRKLQNTKNPFEESKGNFLNFLRTNTEESLFEKYKELMIQGIPQQGLPMAQNGLETGNSYNIYDEGFGALPSDKYTEITEIPQDGDEAKWEKLKKEQKKRDQIQENNPRKYPVSTPQSDPVSQHLQYKGVFNSDKIYSAYMNDESEPNPFVKGKIRKVDDKDSLTSVPSMSFNYDEEGTNKGVNKIDVRDRSGRYEVERSVPFEGITPENIEGSNLVTYTMEDGRTFLAPGNENNQEDYIQYMNEHSGSKLYDPKGKGQNNQIVYPMYKKTGGELTRYPDGGPIAEELNQEGQTKTYIDPKTGQAMAIPASSAQTDIDATQQFQDTYGDFRSRKAGDEYQVTGQYKLPAQYDDKGNEISVRPGSISGVSEQDAERLEDLQSKGFVTSDSGYFPIAQSNIDREDRSFSKNTQTFKGQPLGAINYDFNNKGAFKGASAQIFKPGYSPEDNRRNAGYLGVPFMRDGGPGDDYNKKYLTDEGFRKNIPDQKDIRYDDASMAAYQRLIDTGQALAPDETLSDVYDEQGITRIKGYNDKPITVGIKKEIPLRQVDAFKNYKVDGNSVTARGINSKLMEGVSTGDNTSIADGINNVFTTDGIPHMQASNPDSQKMLDYMNKKLGVPVAGLQGSRMAMLYDVPAEAWMKNSMNEYEALKGLNKPLQIPTNSGIPETLPFLPQNKKLVLGSLPKGQEGLQVSSKYGVFPGIPRDASNGNNQSYIHDEYYQQNSGNYPEQNNIIPSATALTNAPNRTENAGKFFSQDQPINTQPNSFIPQKPVDQNDPRNWSDEQLKNSQESNQTIIDADEDKLMDESDAKEFMNDFDKNNPEASMISYSDPFAADVLLGAAQGLAGAFDRRDTDRRQEQINSQMTADNVFTAQAAGASGSRGDYLLNPQGSNFRVDETGQGSQGRFGKVYQEGGEYELSEDEITQILNSGGQIEYLD